MRTINIFNKDIEIREYGCCNRNNSPQIIMPPRLNLFIQITQNCNANCKFCEYHTPSNYDFNIEKLDEIIKEIKSKINLGKFNFTGGEPTLNLELFDKVFKCMESNFTKERHPEITVNTNGIHLKELVKYEDFIDYIGLSHHHYIDEKNYEIFGTKSVASNKDILEFQSKINNKNILQVRCNLINGYIDNFDELKNFLDEMIKLNVRDCGFVTLMPLNDFCNTHQIDFQNLVKLNTLDVIKTNCWHRLDKETLSKKVCECGNYIYSNEKGKVCKFYSRYFCNASLNEGQLVYDGKNLRFGFGGEIIY